MGKFLEHYCELNDEKRECWVTCTQHLLDTNETDLTKLDKLYDKWLNDSVNTLKIILKGKDKVDYRENEWK
jgi:hypothetical protein